MSSLTSSRSRLCWRKIPLVVERGKDRTGGWEVSWEAGGTQLQMRGAWTTGVLRGPRGPFRKESPQDVQTLPDWIKGS